jgi:hypothetical protein
MIVIQVSTRSNLVGGHDGPSGEISGEIQIAVPSTEGLYWRNILLIDSDPPLKAEY